MPLPLPRKLFNDSYDAQSVVNCGKYGDQTLRYFQWVAAHWRHRFLIARIKKHWQQRYWPEIYRAALKEMAFYERENLFGKKPFEIRVNRSGGWIRDDVMLELHFFDPNGDYSFPIWVVAFKGYAVIHSQASF
jgi:hypothetical protein